MSKGEDMSYGLNSGWGGRIGEHIGCWGGPIKGYTTNLVQDSHGLAGRDPTYWNGRVNLFGYYSFAVSSAAVR